MKRGANWYQREPHAYLGGVRGLPAKLHAVYSVVLDLIYDGGGECPNDPKWISGWFSDLGPASVRRAISDLCDIGKLAVEGDFLTNKRATIEAKTDRETREKRRESGRKGGQISGERRSEKTMANNDINDLFQASASTENEPEKSREEKKEKREPTGSPKKATRLSEDWTLPKPWGEWAVDEGLDEQEVRDQADVFRDYWIAAPGQKGVKLNWQATWRNWMRKYKRDRATSRKTEDGGEIARMMERSGYRSGSMR